MYVLAFSEIVDIFEFFEFISEMQQSFMIVILDINIDGMFVNLELRIAMHLMWET